MGTAILLLRPSMEIAYTSLQQWLAESQHISKIYIVSTSAEHKKAIPPFLPIGRRFELSYIAPTGGIRYLMRWFLRLSGRLDAVVILCHNDVQPREGYTILRVISQLLLSRRCVLIGPQTQELWHAKPLALSKEVFTIMLAVIIAFSTTILALLAAFSAALLQNFGRERRIE